MQWMLYMEISRLTPFYAFKEKTRCQRFDRQVNHLISSISRLCGNFFIILVLRNLSTYPRPSVNFVENSSTVHSWDCTRWAEKCKLNMRESDSQHKSRPQMSVWMSSASIVLRFFIWHWKTHIFSWYCGSYCAYIRTVRYVVLRIIKRFFFFFEVHSVSHGCTRHERRWEQLRVNYWIGSSFFNNSCAVYMRAPNTNICATSNRSIF
jgi:hypothetical protein